MTKAGAFLVCAMFAAACGVGDEGEDIVPIDPNPLKAVCNAAFKTTGTFQQNGPAIDDNGTPADTSDDIEIAGCFPIGTWTFTATVDTEAEVPDINGDGVGDRCGENGTAAPQLPPSFEFRVDRVDSPDGTGKVDKYFAKCGGEYFNLSDDTNNDGTPDGLAGCNAKLGFTMVRLKVSEGGGGQCEGIIEFMDTTRKKAYNLHPAQTGATLSGFGEYTEFLEEQPIGGS